MLVTRLPYHQWLQLLPYRELRPDSLSAPSSLSMKMPIALELRLTSWMQQTLVLHAASSAALDRRPVPTASFFASWVSWDWCFDPRCPPWELVSRYGQAFQDQQERLVSIAHSCIWRFLGHHQGPPERTLSPGSRRLKINFCIRCGLVLDDPLLSTPYLLVFLLNCWEFRCIELEFT